MKREQILTKLKELKPKYSQEGIIIQGLFGSHSRDEATDSSDIDILIEAKPDFASKYGFKAIERINEIRDELTAFFGTPVDLADRTGMGKTGKKFIIDRTIYV
ncbi:MAG: nucleotidyltransferase family protein [Campylobacterales bacterium]